MEINGMIMYFTHMTRYTFVFVIIFALAAEVAAQGRDELPVREYTNRDEVVTFDRTTPFNRALDVINEFAQEYRNKVVIDRTDISDNIGISVPPMHWMDALRLILNVKQRHLIERPEYYEIVRADQMMDGQTVEGSEQGQGTAAGSGEGPIVTIGTREVRINAIFFEGNRRALREIGVDWSTLSNNVPENVNNFTGTQQGGGGGGGGSGGGGGQQGQLPSTEFEGPFVQVNSRGAQSVSQNVFNALVNVGQIGNTGIEVQALFSAFEADNLGEILASPTVKVMDGEQGTIQVGQDFSIKQRDFAGNVTDNFVSVGTILEVTPQVLVHDDTTFIHLTLRAERSSAQPDPVSTIINKQEAETHSLLLDGEATVIAGLYRTEKAEVRRGIPILKDLPPWFFGLRYLFGFSSDDYQMSELVILVQASLEPSIPERFASGDFDNKFKLLRDERVNYRREIQQREDAFAGRIIGEEGEGLNQPEPEEDEPVTYEVREEDKNGLEEEAKEMPDEEQTMVDPEIRTQEIPIEMAREPADRDSLTAAEDTAAVMEEPPAMEVEEEEEPPAETTGEGVSDEELHYFIIGGSFTVEDNAETFREQLANEGFDAMLLQVNSKYLVSYRGYIDRAEARKALADIRQYYNSDAWMFTRE